MEASPVAYKQPCPICDSEQHVKCDGRNQPRQIRHLSILGRKSYVHVPSQRLTCTRFGIRFVWMYDFVGPKQRYSRAFRAETVEQALGSTSAHSARMQDVPASTVQRMHQDALPTENERLMEQAWREAKDTAGLVLGIDDFAIKKGHTYNTGIHNLRGETMLDLLAGRKLDELRAYARQHPEFLALNPQSRCDGLGSGVSYVDQRMLSECHPHCGSFPCS
ncbi:transposase [Paenibacillus sp. SYP-B4298]|uniref:transposase n=1 Tax=Paenibacillus sp. SYP-B4298 TaxID=2996034 RepID=UPI0022DE564D|nr:transposase [Paenibacillus sp. SYP-B4298]